MKYSIFCFLILLLGTACGNRKQTPATGSTPQPLRPRMGMSISDDREKLGRLIDLRNYPPVSVVFQWNGQNTDGLEALLVFDEKTYGALLTAYMDAGFPKGDYTREQFDFPWLDSAQHAELHFSKPDYKGNPDIFLGTRGKGRLWFLDKKLLLQIQP